MAYYRCGTKSNGITLTPIATFKQQSSSVLTETETLTDGIYLINLPTANAQLTDIAFSGTGAYTELFRRDSTRGGDLTTIIVKVTGTVTATITLTPDSSYTSAYMHYFIFQIEGATTFTSYYALSNYDSSVVYDLSNLASGSQYLVILSGTSIFTENDPTITYPYSLSNNVMTKIYENYRYYSPDKAIQVVLCEQHSSSAYAAGRYGGAGTIVIIEIS